MKEKTKPALDRLLRGISTDHVETVRDAWREILQGGAESVAQIQEKLASPAWAENPRVPLSKYLGVLLALLDELDSSAFESEISRLRRRKLHPLHGCRAPGPRRTRRHRRSSAIAVVVTVADALNTQRI